MDRVSQVQHNTMDSMSFNRSSSRAALAIAAVLLLSSVGGTAAAKTGRIVVYWGQDGREGTLRDACNSNLYSTVIISFLNGFGGGKYNLNTAGHPRNGIGPDVKFCQSKKILVLLAIGGGVGTYSLSSTADAKAVADHLWNFYLGGSSSSRPFGDAVLDGVDFDIELGGAAHYDELAKFLSDYSKKGKKKVWITAAPQCPFPDRLLGQALRTGLFDSVHVQFYNNPVCNYAASNVAAFTRAWNTWTSSLPKSSVYLGLPAAPAAAGNGYIPPDTLVSKVLPIVQKSGNYGGVMLWSRYFDVLNGYSNKIKGSVLAADAGEPDDSTEGADVNPAVM